MKKCNDPKGCGIISAMVETIDLGPAPASEDCVQLGVDGYEIKANAECSAYINQLRRIYAAAHNGEQPPCRLRIKANPHDFGTYYEVVASFKDTDEAATNAAFWLENNSPLTWDEEALQELGR